MSEELREDSWRLERPPKRDIARIRSVRAREILDSRGLPTVEVDVVLEGGRVGRASVPSGASMGPREAVELHDAGGSRRGVHAALESVEHVIAPFLICKDVRDPTAIDVALAELDGTVRKEALGANAILAVSLAVARASALVRRRPLYRALGNPRANLLPLPLFNLLNGGSHADNALDIEKFMVAPVGAASFREALGMGAEMYQALKALLHRRGLGTAVGDEGGFAPSLCANAQAIELLLEATTLAGYAPGRDVVLALDVAAGRLFDSEWYHFARAERRAYHTDQLIALYEAWVRQYPIASIEDGLAEDDPEGWRRLTERLGARIQLAGDDIFATQERLVNEGVDQGVANAVVIKLNQVGTIAEAVSAMGAARAAHYATIVSHRSGETPDDFIADFAVATSAGQIKAGAPSRERVAKYNQLARIEEQLVSDARFAGGKAFASWNHESARDGSQARPVP